MSNIEQELKAALAAIDLYDYTMTVEESEKFAKAERLCKSALAEIGKCEPVGWWTGKEAPEDDFMTEALKQEHIKRNSFTWREFPIPLYTSPISKEWVGLSDDEVLEISKKLSKTLPNKNIDFDYAKAIEAKLKQLNTKG